MTKICRLFYLSPLAAAFAALPAWANETNSKLGAVVVTAARSPQAEAEVMADLSVIDREEIERSGAASLAELLQRQPGVEITSNGGPGTAAGIFLRGANSGHTLVLIDGLRVDSSTLGGTALEALPLAGVERIEILRGPASGLYGADALGGVIQLFTRRGNLGVHGQARAGAGSGQRYEAQGSLQGGGGPWRYALSASLESERGFSALRDPSSYSYNPDRDGYRREHASARVDYRFDDAQEVALWASQSRLKSQYDAGPDFDDRGRSQLQSISAQYRGEWRPGWSVLLRWAQGVDDNANVGSWGSSEVRTRQTSYTWQNDLRLPLGEVQLAFERRDERVDSDTGYLQRDRNTDSVLAVYRLNAAAHSVQANWRHDSSSQYGGEATGSLSYGYRLGEGWRVSAAAGTAYKAPSFNDLYYPGFGNADLRPESARNAEVSLRYAQGSFEAKAVVFDNRVDDLIVFMCDLDYHCAPYNVDRAKLRGLSVAASWRRDGVELKAHVDAQRPENAQTGAWLPRRARLHGGAEAQLTLGGWKLTAEWLASGKRFEDAANLRPMAGYAIVNLAASHEFSKGWSLLGRVNNLLDREFELAKGYGTPGRGFFIALQYRS